jgi:hypothetical protein
MRTPGLLLVLLISVPLIAADESHRSASSATPVVADTSSPQTFQDVAIVTNRLKSELRRRGNGPTENFNDAVCATMRTYVVAREEPGSDATRVVGYARCQPAWKFQLRTADQKVLDHSR